jgi:hypothetical protein
MQEWGNIQSVYVTASLFVHFRYVFMPLKKDIMLMFSIKRFFVQGQTTSSFYADLVSVTHNNLSFSFIVTRGTK